MAGQTNGFCLLSAQGGAELQYRYLERVVMHMLNCMGMDVSER